MGVKSLNTLISNYTSNGEKKVHLSKFKGYKLAIDTNVYLYKYLYGKSNHINGIFFMINKMKKFNIKPIFIFDGKPPEEKNDKIIQRKAIRNKLQQRLLNLKSDLTLQESDEEKQKIQEEIENIEKKIMYVNRLVIEKTQNLFDHMGVAYINANCEAEQYCSKLCRMGLVDGVVSEDTDTIACGSKIVLRDFSNRDDNITYFSLDEILYELNLNYNSFIDLCILLGNDYNNRPRGYGPDKIFELIQKFGNIETILEKGQIKYLNFDYESIRNIIKLNNIDIDINQLQSQWNKSSNIENLISFLDENSTIEKKTYLHRIKLMYNNKGDISPRSKFKVGDSPYLKNLKNSYSRFSFNDLNNFNCSY